MPSSIAKRDCWNNTFVPSTSVYNTTCTTQSPTQKETWDPATTSRIVFGIIMALFALIGMWQLYRYRRGSHIGKHSVISLLQAFSGAVFSRSAHAVCVLSSRGEFIQWRISLTAPPRHRFAPASACPTPILAHSEVFLHTAQVGALGNALRAERLKFGPSNRPLHLRTREKILKGSSLKTPSSTV